MNRDSLLQYKIDCLCETIAKDLKEAYKKRGWSTQNFQVIQTWKRKYICIDIYSHIECQTGYYMVDKETEEIFDIKQYGKIDKSKGYGTLETIDNYYWGGNESSTTAIPKVLLNKM